MPRTSYPLLLVSLVFAALASAGCGPEYPACDTDNDCHEAEYCVNGQCQQCRTSADCATGQQCNAGRCDAIPGYCDANTPCPDGQECQNNRCVAVSTPQCDANTPCPTGQECIGGSCSPISGYCDATVTCPGGQLCENNRCRAMCSLDAVYFEFDSSSLDADDRAALQRGGECAQGDRSGSSLRAVGHADPRGTEEYNLVLSENRARAVQRYLRSLGVRNEVTIVGRGEEMAQGYDESSWARDRRVDLE